jgi:hypothetical protein
MRNDAATWRMPPIRLFGEAFPLWVLVVIPVVVGSNPISHPKFNDLEGAKSATFQDVAVSRLAGHRPRDAIARKRPRMLVLGRLRYDATPIVSGRRRHGRPKQALQG